jgi:hypothetical protein
VALVKKLPESARAEVLLSYSLCLQDKQQSVLAAMRAELDALQTSLQGRQASLDSRAAELQTAEE